MSSRVAPLLVAASMLAVACGAEPNEPEPGNDAFRVISGGRATDTISAELRQPLVVEIPAAPAGAIVRFESSVSSPAFVMVSALGGAYVGYVGTPLDQRRRATVYVKLGRVAGQAHLRVAIPELDILDSVPFTIRPGAPTRLIAGPRDTAVVVGQSLQLRTTVMDRFDNPREATVTLTALDPVVTVSGTRVTGTVLGRGRVEAQAHGLRDAVTVSVVPDGVLSAVVATGSGHQAVVFRTDGTRIAAYPAFAASTSADWSPDGEFLVLDTWGRLQIIRADGSTSQIGVGGLVLYPEVSHDGQWIYYAVQTDGQFDIRRVRPSGADDSFFMRRVRSVALSMSPSGTEFTYTSASPGVDELMLVTLPSFTEISLGNGHTSAWAPNGTDLAFVSGETLWAIDMSTRQPRRQIGSQDRFALGIDWSPDGKWLVGSAGGRFVLVEATSGLTIPLGFTAGWTAPAWRE